MAEDPNQTSLRKKEHIELCLTDEVAFKSKSNGFDQYDFVHYAITETDIQKISFSTKFFGNKINFPFIISCMTGGTKEAENINLRLAEAAAELNIPLGVGSQRQALENERFHKSYKIIRLKAPGIPILGNIGAAQLVQFKTSDPVIKMINMVEANAMVIHVNPLQELLQKDGEPNFKGLLKSLRKLVRQINIPVIVKEVGAGISLQAAAKLLDCGVKGIDVAGAGGTSWAGVELLRNRSGYHNEFWDWGLPTSYCIKEIYKLKKNKQFLLIASGGIYNGFDMAKAFALGADMAASARVILKQLEKGGAEDVSSLVRYWFDTVKKIMYLTGSASIKELQKKRLIRKEELF